MGALQVEVKILKKAPLLFAWENRDSHQVEGYLITCQCQHLGLQGAAGDDQKSSSSLQGGDEVWAAKLAHALEISEVVSLSSMDPCVGVGYVMEYTDGEEKSEHRHRKKKKKKTKKSPKNKKHLLQEWESGISEKDTVPLHNEEDRHVDSDIVGQDQKSANSEAKGEQAPSESQSSMETSSGPGESKEQQIDCDGSFITDKNSASGDIVARDNEHSSAIDMPVHTKDVSTSRNEKHFGDTPNSSQVIPGEQQLSGTGGDPVVIETPASDLNIPASEEEAIMNAISSIMEMYPGAVVDVPQTIHQVKLAEGASDLKNVKRDVPEFIRNLTEEERKDMFKFQSDDFEKNLKKLQEGGKCYLCEHCGKVIASTSRKKHMQIHSEVPRPRDITCELCGKSFYEKSTLIRHMVSHSSEPQFKCRYCSKKYKSMFGRTMHERAHFNVYAGECNRCDRKFRDSRNYKLHMARDCTINRRRRRERQKGTEEKNMSDMITCNACGKQLRSSSLQSHMDMHAEKMFKCPICKKSVRYSTRYVHLNVHREERNFLCDVCNKSFKTRGVLNNHMMTHTGERPVKCRYCDKTFSRYGSRVVHETSHTGERPFPCTICNKGWKDRPTYMAHMRKHHPGTPVYYKRKSSIINQLMEIASASEETGQPQHKEPS